RFPRFHFQHADIHNRTYNPGARCQARDYRFPYADNSFDFVFLSSVFTHMLPDDLRNYVCELRRVLKRGGKCFASFFLLHPGSPEGMATPQAGRTFPHAHDAVCRVADRDWPEDAVAYEERFVFKLFEKAGLAIDEITYGCWWHGEANGQDHVWTVKC